MIPFRYLDVKGAIENKKPRRCLSFRHRLWPNTRVFCRGPFFVLVVIDLPVAGEILYRNRNYKSSPTPVKGFPL